MRRLPLALSALLVLSVAACGSDSSSSSDTDGGSDGKAATATAGDEFCVAAQQMNDTTTAFGIAALGGDSDAAALEAAMKKVQADGAAVLAVSPTDIEAKVKTSVDAFDQVAVALEKAGWDFTAASADADFTALMTSADLKTNGDAIDAYLLEKCNIGS
jgi:hypothetical protein